MVCRGLFLKTSFLTEYHVTSKDQRKQCKDQSDLPVEKIPGLSTTPISYPQYQWVIVFASHGGH